MNLVPGSEVEPDKSPGGGAKVRNPAQGVRIGETVPQRSRRPQASPARHGEPFMRNSKIAAASQKQEQDRKYSYSSAGQSAQPSNNAHSKRRTANQVTGTWSSDQENSTIPETRKQETSEWNHQRRKNIVRQRSQTTRVARHNPAAATMQ